GPRSGAGRLLSSPALSAVICDCRSSRCLARIAAAASLRVLGVATARRRPRSTSRRLGVGRPLPPSLVSTDDEVASSAAVVLLRPNTGASVPAPGAPPTPDVSRPSPVRPGGNSRAPTDVGRGKWSVL